jgi:hypothetical protein
MKPTMTVETTTAHLREADLSAAQLLTHSSKARDGDDDSDGNDNSDDKLKHNA